MVQPFDQTQNDYYYPPNPLQSVDQHGLPSENGNSNGEINGNMMQRNGSGSGTGSGTRSGEGSGRQTPQIAPAPALGFYPHPTQPLQGNMDMADPYFSSNYSLDPNQLQNQYRPSPLNNDQGYDASNCYATTEGSGNGNGNGYHQTMVQDETQTQSQFQYPGYSVPPPRSSGSYSHDPAQMLSQAMYGFNVNNGNGTMPNPQCTDDVNQFFSNPLFNNYPMPPLHENSIQGTISPAALGVVNKAFSGLVMSRGSSSSASSTEGGRDFTTTSTPLLDDGNHGSTLAYSNMAHFPSQPSFPNHTSNPVRMSGINSETENAIQQYFTTPNRLAYGERRLVIYTPKVGQKSYGTEKRFLCPHPLVMMYGSAWWTAQGDNSPTCPIVPPSVNISLSGEEVIKDSPVNWTTVSGKELAERINIEAIQKREQPFMGNVAGRHLHVSDNGEKRSSFSTLVRIRAPSALAPASTGYGKGYLGTEASEIIGTFESKEIKIISKPSKKKTNTKSTECMSCFFYHSVIC